MNAKLDISHWYLYKEAPNCHIILWYLNTWLPSCHTILWYLNTWLPSCHIVHLYLYTWRPSCHIIFFYLNNGRSITLRLLRFFDNCEIDYSYYFLEIEYLTSKYSHNMIFLNTWSLIIDVFVNYITNWSPDMDIFLNVRQIGCQLRLNKVRKLLIVFHTVKCFYAEWQLAHQVSNIFFVKWQLDHQVGLYFSEN